MEIHYDRLKRIIVTDRPFPYKPDRATLNKLGAAFPDISIIGFGKYEQGYWVIMAFSKYFPENTPFSSGAVPMQEAFKWIPTLIKPL